MYKIVFVVAVFAFALQGAFSSPVVEEAVAVPNAAVQPAETLVNAPKAEALENKPNGDPAPAAPTTTTAKPTSGATTSEVCILLVQISSLALVTKHMFL